MNSFTQSLQDSLFIGSLFIAALFIICTVSLALRNYEIRHEIKKLKKWRKFSEIEKKQRHEEFDLLATELAEERKFNDTQGDMHVRLMLKYASIQEHDDKLRFGNTSLRTDLKDRETELEEVSKERYRIACKNTYLKDELKIAQTCLKVAETEIAELKSKLSRKNLKRDEKGRVLPKADRDWTTATEEELLAEAKRRYPVGTKVKSLYHNGNPHIKIETVNFEHVRKADIHAKTIKSFLCPVVYSHGKWAEVC